jgi:hypothetical protein
MKNEKSRAEAVKQVLASWAIEGGKPDTHYMQLAERYIKGEITTAQMRNAILEYYSSTAAQ